VRKSCRRALQSLPARRIASPANRLDDPAEKTPAGFAAEPRKACPIDHHRPGQVEFQELQRGLGQASVVASPPPTRPIGRRRWAYSRFAQARPLEAAVDVRRVVDPRYGPRLEGRGQASPRDREQRPQQAGLPLFDQRRHTGKAVWSAQPGGAHRYRLGLIVGMMSEQQMQDAMPSAGLEHQPVARLAGGFLEAARGLGPQPAQHLGGDAMAGKEIACARRFAR